MKIIIKSISLLSFFILAFFLSNCKEPETKELEIETISVTDQQDGTVLLIGRINSDGGSSVNNYGFCISTDSMPGLDDKVIGNPSKTNDRFSAIYDDFDIQTKYYFRAFGNNQLRGTFGAIKTLDSIKPVEVIAPCTPALNTVNLGMGNPSATYTGLSAVDYGNRWILSGAASGVSFSYRFEKKPTNGFYTTEISGWPKGRAVHILLGYDFSDYIINAGAIMYVKQLSKDKWDISLCDAPFKYVLGLNAKLSTRITYP